MKIIIPMAGRGTRLRPHTLTVPKPLIKIAGKPIVQRLVEDLAAMSDEKLDEVAFVIGDFGKDVENSLLAIAESVGAKGKLYYQEKPLGTAHAVMCAKPSLEGNIVVAFADTLFKADFKIDRFQDGVIWVHKVTDPSQFGVVKINEFQEITDFIEKPKTFVSDLAIIGIYYFRDGKKLADEVQYLYDNNLTANGEYQLTTALENMKKKGFKFIPATVKAWLDCGNKDATVDTNKQYLEFIKHQPLIAESAKVTNSVIVSPVFIGENVRIHNSVVGPHVSVGNDSEIYGSVIQNSIIQEKTTIINANLTNSMIGSYVRYEGRTEDLSLGDY
ncbi:MAG: sugar phosphate nucleotidyltransferase, partial [Flammeovirgaceae bacterium]|nr:sugar phosphate nucleotidyltransferase [Flammeovirgaceae bacterium]MDW8288422.1 sugar phosphate nucleotidyltransferase [Flammeovirgaceae bacterium]